MAIRGLSRKIALVLATASASLLIQAPEFQAASIASASTAPLTAQITSFPSANIVVTNGEAPFDVSFRGGLASTATSCHQLIRDADIAIAWSYGDNSVTDASSDLLDYPEEYFYKTLKITSEGIDCQLSHPILGSFHFPLSYSEYIGGWGNTVPLVEFAGAESAQIHVDVYANNAIVGSKDGPLYNPYFAPYSAEITGLSRGQNVGRAFEVKVSGAPPKSEMRSSELLLNGRTCTDSIYTCEVVSIGDNDWVVLLAGTSDGNGTPETLSVQVNYTVRNKSQFYAELSTQAVTVQVDPDTNNAPRIDWPLAKYTTNKLVTWTDCKNKSESPKDTLTCTVLPLILRPDENNSYESYDASVFDTSVPVRIIYQLDNGPWVRTTAQLTVATSRKSTFKFKVPNKDHKRLRIRVVSGEISSYAAGQAVYGSMPTAPKLNNYLVLPSTIFWNQPFLIRATPHGGVASTCTFFAADERTVLGSAKVIKGVAQVRVKTVWAATFGTRTTVVIYAACKYGSKTYWDYSYTNGYR